MINTLNLRMRYNCSPDLASYAAEFPLLIRRELYLQLDDRVQQTHRFPY